MMSFTQVFNSNKYVFHFQDFLTRNLTADNVCPILQNAMHLDAQDLVTRCFNIIDSKTKAVFNSKSFLTIRGDTLKQIMERDGLVGATEIEIFEGCVNWAEKECHRRGLRTSPVPVLGDVLPLVRFPVMPLDAFCNDMIPTEILTMDETLSIFLYLTQKGSNRGNPQPPFPTVKRVMNRHGNGAQGVTQRGGSRKGIKMCPFCMISMPSFQILCFNCNTYVT